MEFPQEVKNRTIIWSSNFTSGFLSEENESRDLNRYLYGHVHSSIIHNSQNVEATQESISRSNVVYTYNGILFSLKKAGNADTCYNVDES